MLIFSRQSTAKPDRIAKATDLAVELAKKVTTITGRQILVYRTLFGAPMGTIAWSTRVESLADLHEVTSKLAVDPGYQDLAAKRGELFATNPQDMVMNIVSSTLTEPKAFYGTTAAMAANGKVAEAMDFGVRAQTLVAKKTGLPSAFGASPFGPYGAVGWLTGGDSITDIDKLHEFMTTDPSFAKLVAEAGELFVEGSASNTLIERIH